MDLHEGELYLVKLKEWPGSMKREYRLGRFLGYGKDHYDWIGCTYAREETWDNEEVEWCILLDYLKYLPVLFKE